MLKDDQTNLSGEDVREGLTAVISVKLTDPQFEGQTKGKLGNADMKSLVESAMSEGLGKYLEEHPQDAREDSREVHDRCTGSGGRTQGQGDGPAQGRLRRRKPAG